MSSHALPAEALRREDVAGLNRVLPLRLGKLAGPCRTFEAKVGTISQRYNSSVAQAYKVYVWLQARPKNIVRTQGV